VCILPQTEQGNLALRAVLVTGAITGVAADVVMETVVGIGIDDGLLNWGGGPCEGYVGTFDMNGGVWIFESAEMFAKDEGTRVGCGSGEPRQAAVGELW
jgi:hypothetical protein